jgi:hypothetical protein
MPYAPGISYDTTSVANGMAGGLQGLEQGFKEFQMNKAKSTAAAGIVTGLLQSTPELMTGADEKTLKLLEKFKAGNTGLNDNVMLAGWAATTQKGLQQKQEMMAQQAQVEALKRQNAMAAQAQAQDAADNAALNTAFGGEPEKFLETYTKNKGSIAGLKKLGFDVDRMLYPKPTTFDIERVRSTDTSGNPIEISIDKHTGKEIARGPVQRAVLSPEEEGRKAGLIEEAKSKAEGATKFLSDLSDSAEDARQTSATVERIVSLYKEGAQTGFAQPTLTKIRSALARFGGGKEEIANQQQLEKELNNLVLERGRVLMKGGGSVSNYEREAVEKASANANLTPESNLQILGVLQAIGKRNLILEKKRLELEDDGLTSVEISKKLRTLRDSLPINVEALNAAAQAAPSASPAATTKPTGPTPKLPPGWSIR